jgi:hypothetical protein
VKSRQSTEKLFYQKKIYACLGVYQQFAKFRGASLKTSKFSLGIRLKDSI